MALLDVQSLTAHADGRRLITDLSFSVAPGEVLSIVGPNGAGKSSVLRAISGELAPTNGELHFNQRPLADWSAAQKATAMAVLAQEQPLSFAFTVADVVALGRSPHSSGEVADRNICQEAMAALDLTHLANRLYPSLSGGEKQRTQLARVMAQIWRAEGQTDRLLVLDEPVASLDLGHQKQLMRAVRDFAARGVGVILVLHDIGLAAAYSDRLLALKEGKLAALGAPEAVVTEVVIGSLFDTEVQVVEHPATGKPVVLSI